MNICFCGAQQGYLHHAFCPFPLFRATEKREQEWQDGWDERQKTAQAQISGDDNHEPNDQTKL